jgi:uncharacterized protein
MYHDPSDPPVTICVLRSAKPGKEKEFEQVVSSMIASAMEFPGHLGTSTFRPMDADNPEYRIIFKFDKISNLKRWEESQVRQRWLELVEPLSQGTANVEKLTGLETWFTLPAKKAIVPPSRYKMALITGLAIFCLINIINFLFAPILNSLPPLIRSFVLITCLVSLMTYVVMPQMTKLFAKWLYPRQ